MKKVFIILVSMFVFGNIQASVARPRIDSTAKNRLERLLDDQSGGFSAELQRVIPSVEEQLSLQDLQQKAVLKKQEFEMVCRIATQEVQHRAAIILKDYNIDDGLYKAYLEGEYANSIDQKARYVLECLQKRHVNQVQAALEREKNVAYQASRPFRLGSSLLTNVVHDARDDFSSAAAITGAGAVALPYVPLKTREKLEEGIGNALVKHPGYAVASLAALVVGWQGVKYGMRYFFYRNQAANFEKQAQSIQLVPEWNEKAVFLAYVPSILERARESATIVHLAESSQLAQQELQRLAGLVEQQDGSLKSLQTSAQAHGASLERVQDRLVEVRDRQQADAQRVEKLILTLQAQRSDIRYIKKGIGKLLAISAASPYESDSEISDSASGIVSGAGARAHSVRSQNFSIASHLSAGSTLAQIIAQGPSQSLSARILGASPLRSARRVARGAGLSTAIPDSFERSVEQA